MSRTMAHLLEEALHLTEPERGELAARLIDSLETTGEDDDADVAASWREEIARRLADMDHGRVQTIPWSEARRMIQDESDHDASG
jgi:putative addiction module component (TIGR02574 family)